MTNRRTPIGKLLIANFVTAFLALMLIGCSQTPASQYESTESSNTQMLSVTRPALSDTALAGESLFNAKCSLCHGANAAGTNQGPPLIDRIYEPGHHPDVSFRVAVRQGVRQHHWQFGNMPPVPSVSDRTTWRKLSATSGRCNAPTASLKATSLQLLAEPDSD